MKTSILLVAVMAGVMALAGISMAKAVEGHSLFHHAAIAAASE